MVANSSDVPLNRARTRQIVSALSTPTAGSTTPGFERCNSGKLKNRLGTRRRHAQPSTRFASPDLVKVLDLPIKKRQWSFELLSRFLRWPNQESPSRIVSTRAAALRSNPPHETDRNLSARASRRRFSPSVLLCALASARL